MAVSERLHKGMVIRHEGQVYMVLDYRIAQTGKQKPTVHVKLRSIKGGSSTERTLDELGKIEEVPSEVRPMQYLYAAGEDRVFMDSESFEQYTFGRDVVGDGMDLLVEEETYRFLTVDGQPVCLQLPSVLVMEVADTAPVEHAGGASNVQKEAKLACGITIHVPLFIKNGDKIRIKTDSREYQGKEH
jgi:elongation factor P